MLTEYDLYLLREGTHYSSFEKLGAHPATVDGEKGTNFAVWAPNAAGVSVVGDFNNWDRGRHPMDNINSSGFWELFIPDIGEGALYKYAIRSMRDRRIRLKTDPYAFSVEVRPGTAAIVCGLEQYEWHDSDWLERRKTLDWLTRPISIYEVHLGSWKRNAERDNGFLTYRELAKDLIPYLKDMGYTHVELLPVMEHPFDGSWGYQVVNYYAATSRFGHPCDFMYFVDECHRNNIGVMLDWVPSHFPRDDYGLADFDGTHLYNHMDWRRGEHKEWGTYVFNYSRNEVRNFLISNAIFWLKKYHADGLRVDAVASMLYLDYSRKDGEWVCNEFGGRENLEAIAFLKKFNEIAHGEFPGILTIAEESTAWTGVSRPTYSGGLGFSMKWNMGWMHDQLLYFSKDPVHRKYHHDLITFSMLYAFTENFILPVSHDEVVYGKRSMLDKMPGDIWQKFANVRLFLGYMFGHPGKKLMFMGSEFGQWIEWNYNQSLDWHLLEYPMHQKLHRYVKDLNHLYQKYSAFYEIDFNWDGFEWIDFHDVSSGIVSFLRKSRDKSEVLVFVCNLTPVIRHDYRVGVPSGGFYREIFNSDALEYGGSGVGNLGGVGSEQKAWHCRGHSINLVLPPLAIDIFRFEANA